MNVIGDRHYQALPGEIVTFVLEATDQVGSIAVTSAFGTSLPLNVPGGTHQVVTITAGFQGSAGGGITVGVTGSIGGSDSSRIRQLTSLPFRSGIFIVD